MEYPKCLNSCHRSKGITLMSLSFEKDVDNHLRLLITICNECHGRIGD